MQDVVKYLPVNKVNLPSLSQTPWNLVKSESDEKALTDLIKRIPVYPNRRIRSISQARIAGRESACSP